MGLPLDIKTQVQARLHRALVIDAKSTRRITNRFREHQTTHASYFSGIYQGK